MPTASDPSYFLSRIDWAWRNGIRPEPQIPVAQWADRHRILPDTAAEPGRWRTARTPYLKEIMDTLSTGSPYERVVMMKGAQTGGTEAGLNFLGYIIQNAPGLVMLVQPSLDMVRRNTVTRIDPLIASSPVLRDLVLCYVHNLVSPCASSACYGRGQCSSELAGACEDARSHVDIGQPYRTCLLGYLECL